MIKSLIKAYSWPTVWKSWLIRFHAFFGTFLSIQGRHMAPTKNNLVKELGGQIVKFPVDWLTHHLRVTTRES